MSDPMLSRQELLQSILFECDIAKHLATKIPAGGLEYRQSDGQRSTLEILRYLAFCGIGGALAMRDGSWDGYKAWEARTSDLTLDGFAAAMDEQKAALEGFFAEVDEEGWQAEATHPLGTRMSLAAAVLETTLKWLAAYRMQLFCAARAAGNDEIWTPDCWGGVSMPRDTRPAGS